MFRAAGPAAATHTIHCICGWSPTQPRSVLNDIVIRRPIAYSLIVNRLTRQEQTVLCIVIGLLLLGWTVKAYRASHPSVRPDLQVHSNGAAAESSGSQNQ